MPVVLFNASQWEAWAFTGVPTGKYTCLQRISDLTDSLRLEALFQSAFFDVNGGVDTAAVFCPAYGADPAARLGGKLLVDCAAGRTNLGSRCKTIHLQQLLALPVELVAQHFAEHPKAGVEDILTT